MIVKKDKVYVIVNFGGPRDLGEVEEFLVSLFNDREVIRTNFPALIHRWLFTWAAKKRSKQVSHDYVLIGGKSPIFEDTEQVARVVSKLVGSSVLTFHRYLPKTHPAFLAAMEQIAEDKEIVVFPMFPQFSYATTGSIASWFEERIPPARVRQMVWVKSYSTHPLFLACFEQIIHSCLKHHQWEEDKTVLLFSAHGVPVSFITTGDVYQKECEQSFLALASRFPQAFSQLSYQSQLGKAEWIKPSTASLCTTIHEWALGYQNVLVIPLSFTSDHIETLYEVEKQYLPPLEACGFKAARCPALNLSESWLKAIASMMQEDYSTSTYMLLRH